jgi:phospholipid transport system substrate-binding protein
MIYLNFNSISALRLLFARQPLKRLRGCIAVAVLLFTSLPGYTTEAEVSAAPETKTEVSVAPEAALVVESANDVVAALHENLLHIMQNAQALAYKGRYDHIYDVVTSRFDTALIAKVIMSRYWKKLDDIQKSDFIDLFKRLSVATYASRFDGFSGESFVEISTEELKKGRLLIKTELIRPDGKSVRLDYLMHQREGRWLIISVIANGVNDLSLKRAEYASVIKEKSFQGLIDDVVGKIDNMENNHEM